MAKKLLKSGLVRLIIGGLCLTLLLAAIVGTVSPVYYDSSCKCNNEANHKLQVTKLSGVNQENEIKPNKTNGHQLCVIVPFRDRFEELLEFVPHLHKFLKKQGIVHFLVIINQVDRYRFNRASLINAGFLETRNKCDYIAMHDVDLLPETEELRYDFPENGPYHLAAPHIHPLYHYKTYVGGILLLQSKQFELLNGLSNKYWGWGKEDDEFFVRMRKAKLKLSRPGNLTTGTKSLRHIHDRRKRPRDNQLFFDQREQTRRLDKVTGLTTVQYTLDSENQLHIDGAPVTIYNVYLKCDLSFTPWCLKANDHKNFDVKNAPRKMTNPP